MVRFDTDVPGMDAFLDEGDSFGDDPFGGGFDAFAIFPVIFAVVGLLIAGVVVLMVVLAVVNARRLRSKGISPLASEGEIVADAVRGSAAPRLGAQPTAGPAQTLEARLGEIERLHAAGTITAAERDAARAKLLGTL